MKKKEAELPKNLGKHMCEYLERGKLESNQSTEASPELLPGPLLPMPVQSALSSSSSGPMIYPGQSAAL